MGERKVRLMLDTGAAMTLSSPKSSMISATARDGDKITGISTGNAAVEQGYRLRVRYFQALGFGFHDFRIHAHELPDYGVEGLLGMDFLEKFDLEVRMSEQRIHRKRAGLAGAA